MSTMTVALPTYPDYIIVDEGSGNEVAHYVRDGVDGALYRVENGSTYHMLPTGEVVLILS